MSLQALLAQQRQKTKARARERRLREVKALPPGERPAVHVVEEVAAAVFARDFLLDLDRLLEARGLSLFIEWRGSIGQAYVEDGVGRREAIAEVRMGTAVWTSHLAGDFGQSLLVIMRQHRVSLQLTFRGGSLVLLCGSLEVSDHHCLRLGIVSKGQRGRYMGAP